MLISVKQIIYMVQQLDSDFKYRCERSIISDFIRICDPKHHQYTGCEAMYEVALHRYDLFVSYASRYILGTDLETYLLKSKFYIV